MFMGLRKVIGVSTAVVIMGVAGLYGTNKIREQMNAVKKDERILDVLNSNESQRKIKVLPNETY